MGGCGCDKSFQAVRITLPRKFAQWCHLTPGNGSITQGRGSFPSSSRARDHHPQFRALRASNWLREHDRSPQATTSFTSPEQCHRNERWTLQVVDLAISDRRRISKSGKWMRSGKAEALDLLMNYMAMCDTCQHPRCNVQHLRFAAFLS